MTTGYTFFVFSTIKVFFSIISCAFLLQLQTCEMSSQHNEGANFSCYPSAASTVYPVTIRKLTEVVWLLPATQKIAAMPLIRSHASAAPYEIFKREQKASWRLGWLQTTRPSVNAHPTHPAVTRVPPSAGILARTRPSLRPASCRPPRQP